MKKSKRQLLLMRIFNVMLLMTFQIGLTGIFSLVQGSSQQLRITGQVKEMSGNPLPGVTVIVKGTTIGALTDIDGNFTLMVPGDAKTLVFSFVGMISQEIILGNKTKFNLVMEEKTFGLNEVVAIGYGVQKKMTVTGAISSVGTADLVKSPQASIANTLAGRVTGLTSVQYSGQPGADDATLYIRGVGSLSAAASAPITLVDGVERSFTQLDPNEIESIVVLKDASATSVYGVKGANGVIIVTTKRGTTGAPKISFSLSSGVQEPTHIPEYADSYTWAKMYNEATLNDNPAATPKFSNAVLEKYRTHSDPLIYPDFNIWNYALKPSAPQTQQNINISGGTKDVKYFISLGHLSQDGLFKQFDTDYNWNYTYHRYNYRANIDIDVTKTTKLGLNIGGRSESRNAPNQGAGTTPLRYFFSELPIGTAGIIDGKRIVTASKYIPIASLNADGLGVLYGRGSINDVKNVLNLDINLNQKLDFVTKGLAFRAKVASNNQYNHTKLRSTTSAYYEAWYKTDVDATAPGDSTVVLRKFGTDGILGYSESFAKGRDWYLEGGLSYNRNFGDHTVSGLLLYNESKNYYPDVYAEIARGYVGLVGRATYDYKTKYLFEVNLGYNGSENFAPGKRFGLFPSVSSGWVVTEENFMKRFKFLNFLKLRASYGVVGNDRQGSNRFLYLPDSYSANSGGYNFGADNPQNQIIASEQKVGNPDVTWEKAKKQDYGIDMKFANGKLGLNFDYFYEHRDNILTTRNTVPGIIAVTLPAVNIGIVENHGFEIELNWKDKLGDFSYFVKPNMSFARNKVIFMDEIHQPYDYLYSTGLRVGQPFVYVTDGFWTAQDIAHISDFPTDVGVPIPGTWRFQDLNGDGKIDTYDRRPNGFPDYPEYIFSTTVGFNFKGFDFSMLWTGVTNVSRSTNQQTIFIVPFGSSANCGLLQYMVDNRWTPQTASTATFPSLSFKTNGSSGVNTRLSDWSQQDASYLRLKNAEIGYNMNPDFLKRLRLGISALRIYANGNNLLTFTKMMKFIDPEAPINSWGYQYPLMRIYNVGVNVTF
jgi:TonB-linked SusC/RagA family outer membrane protein